MAVTGVKPAVAFKINEKNESNWFSSFYTGLIWLFPDLKKFGDWKCEGWVFRCWEAVGWAEVRHHAVFLSCFEPYLNFLWCLMIYAVVQSNCPAPDSILDVILNQQSHESTSSALGEYESTTTFKQQEKLSLQCSWLWSRLSCLKTVTNNKDGRCLLF